MSNGKKIFIGLSILVVFAIGATFAWWVWQNTEDENTNVSLTVDGMNIEYDSGPNIDGIGLIPVSSKERGVEDSTAIYKEISVTAPMTTYLNLYMTLNSFPSELADKSFLYEVVKNDVVITSGNFLGLEEGDRIELLNREVVNTVESVFKLYIWIDGNQDNPSDMMNKSFGFVLSADGTTDPGDELIKLDDSGANTPNISNGLIPVMYSNDTWVKADTENKESTYKWYDYDSKQWANAVLVSSTNRETYKTAEAGTVIPEEEVLAYYVWIPRYKYKVWNIDKVVGTDSYNARNSGIDIVFEEGTASTGTIICSYSFGVADTTSITAETCSGSNGEYYTHPAFTLGDTDVEGIWVGKYEISSETPEAEYGGGQTTELGVRIKPNLVSWRNNYVDSFEKVIQAMDNTGNEYGLMENSESHMLKNIEWGAIAYLAHSNYGRCSGGTCSEVTINSNGYMTGAGDYITNVGQSTTGNKYGIYDMSGGSFEYVMGNMSNTVGDEYTYEQGSAETDYSIVPYGSEYINKYIDTYAYGTTYNDQSAYNRARLGDATAEVVLSTGGSGGWYDDYARFIDSGNPWFLRGGFDSNGDGAGLFHFYWSTGGISDVYSTRAALIG